MSNGRCAVCQNAATRTCAACNRIFYCCKEHERQDWKRHKTCCKCYEVVVEEALGRCVRATRYIEPGETIMSSESLVLGPKTVSPPLCLGCHKRLDLAVRRYDCSKCFWPLCSPQCEESPYHKDECRIFGTAHFKPSVKNDNSKQAIYSSISPLRALILKKTSPEKFNQVLNCQSHLDTHLSSPVYQILQRNLVPFIREILHVDTTESEIMTICSIFDTNCFEVRDPLTVNIRGLYPTISFLSHDCRQNTRHTFRDNFEIVLTATVPIKKGALITATYTQTLWNTLERRRHLRASKQFHCVCGRCEDPTEFGTFVGSTICNQCEQGKIVSSYALDAESRWRCEECGFEVSCEEIAMGNDFLNREIANLDKSDPSNLEKFLEEYKTVLHGSNSYVLQIKYALCQIYGNIEEPTVEVLNRRTELCKELLDVADILEPGMSRFRGMLLYYMYESMMTRCKGGEKECEVEAKKYLEEASAILKIESNLDTAVQEIIRKEIL